MEEGVTIDERCKRLQMHGLEKLYKNVLHDMFVLYPLGLLLD